MTSYNIYPEILSKKRRSKMTVKELIEILSTLDEKATVLLFDADEGEWTPLLDFSFSKYANAETEVLLQY